MSPVSLLRSFLSTFTKSSPTRFPVGAILSGAAVCLGPVSQAQVFYIQTLQATVTNATVSNTAFAEAGLFGAQGINVSMDLDFSRTGVMSISSSVGGEFRAGFQLLDESGNPVLLETSSGTGFVVYDDDWEGDPDSGFPFSLGAFVSTGQATGLSAVLIPVQQGRLRAALCEVYTFDAAPSTFLHFTGASSGDSAVNTLSVLNGVSINDRSALAGAAPSDDAYGFSVEADVTFHRFDESGLSPAISDVDILYDVSLWRVDPINGDEQIPLVQSEFTVAQSLSTHTQPFFNAVYSLDTFHTFQIVPDGVQLDSVNEVYYARVTIAHLENPATNFVMTGNTEDSADTQLMHFNGSLFWNATETTLEDFTNDPAVGGSWSASYITASLSNAEGFLTGSPGYTWGPTGPTIRLEADGTARVVTPSFSTPLTPPSTPDMDATAGIRFKRTDLTLDHGTPTGLIGTLTVYLPTGMGWAPTAAQHNFDGRIQFNGQNFTQALQPTDSSYTFTNGGSNFAVVEETKPLAYQAGQITWTVATGLVEVIGTGTIGYLREDELAQLEASPVTAAEKIKRSNEQYYRGVGTFFSSVVIPVVPGSSGEALLTTDLSFNNTTFSSHFPYDVQLVTGGGYVAIVDDLIDTTSSYLSSFDPLVIQYNQACVSDDCGVGPMMQSMVLFSNTGQFRFTPDGGLVTTGFIDNSSTPDTLAWGYIDPLGRYHHETTAFSGADFHMPGHFVRGDQDTGPARVYGPGVILYTGALASDPQIVERPATPGYLDGLTDYAGFNLRTLTDSTVFSDSTIAGVPVIFDLTGRSKYYIREAGVTGIHEAVPGTFPANLTLYGYNLDFTQYGLNYRMNQPDESRTEGAVNLPYPSDFTQEFEEMAFTCLGGLDSVKVPAGTGEQTMSYWLANIEILTLGFESENGCDPTADTYLLAGVSAEAAYVTPPLYGTLGYLPSGELMIPSSSTLDVNSRLHLPSVVEFDGPTKNTDPNDPGATATEVYQLVPATLAYYNDYASTSEQAQGDGKINFAGTLDVSFFEDLEVHMQTSARNVLPNQTVPIHLMGGWDESGKTFFNSAGFDDDNTGFPDPLVYPGVSEALYRNDAGAVGDPTPFLIHARQDWLGVINFDYPLKWSTSTRSFESYEPKTNDLLVITAEHKLEYLSAETAELSIGITYEGMPEVNITNFVLNQVDETTGVYQALLQEAKKPVVDTIEDGIDRMGDMLDDSMQTLYGEFLADTVETQIVDPIYDQLYTAANNLTYDPTVIQAVLTNRLKTGSGSLQDLIADLSSGVGNANYLFTEVDNRLLAIELGLTSIIDGVWLDNLGNPIPQPGAIAPDYAAFLGKNLNGEFEILAPLVERLLDELAPDISSELNALLAGAVDDLNARINDLLEEAKPSIDQIIVVLDDLRTVIGEVRTAIAPAGDMLDEFQTILTTSSSEIDAITTEMLTEIDAFFAVIPDPADFLSYTEEEIKTRIRNEIRDIFFSADFVAEIQVTLKQYLYDADAAINAAISEAFAQLNGVIRDLVSDALSEVDDTINGFLGDIDDVMGAGKLNGNAQFNGDALRRLHIDLYLQLMIPDEMEFNGYLTIEQFDSEGDDTCSPGTPGGVVTEVSMGATDVPADWISPDLRISVGAKFNFQSSPNFKLLGLGGSFELTSGEVNFETFRITAMGAALMFGASENYLAAELGLAFNSYEAYGGVYFGRTCSLDPLLMVDEDVAELLGNPNPTFTGIYVYGECHIPVSEAVLGIPASCFFRISAGIGAGAFYFVEGNTLGGKIFASVSGEALCVVSIKGEVTMIGLMTNGELRFKGKGRLSGKAGPCPLCIKFGKTATITYEGGSWGVDL